MKTLKTKYRKFVNNLRATRQSVSLLRRQPNQAAAAALPGHHGGDPSVDAIRGNEIWDVEGGPGTSSVRTCNDGGTELLFQTVNEADQGVATSASTTSFAGAQFDLYESVSRPSTIKESDTEDDPEADAERKLRDMDERLRQSSLVPFEVPGYYVPIDHLRAIVTRDAIRTVLPHIAKGVIPDQFDRLAQDIYGRLEKDQRLPRSFRKILAILILIGKANSIVDFVKADITDAKLPLEKLGKSRTFQLRVSDQEEAIPFFQDWEHRDIENFENKQWETLAPYFSRGIEEDDWVRRYELSSRRPLPFKIIQEPGFMSSGSNKAPISSATGNSSSSELSESIDSMKGAHGKVWKVTIHAAHHNLPSYRGNEDNPSFAIKRLLAADRAEFKNEVGILTSLNRCMDRHLVKLLLTMEILGDPGKESNFFLIFPLADSNLRQFWHHKFPHPEGTSSATYARWVALQCHGLARALYKLHNLPERGVHNPQENGDDKKTSSAEPFYGIHGDIKPENLLWYKDWVGPSHSQAPPDNQDLGPLGVLQLADFGISRLHHTNTRSNANMRRATKTYAPPEVEWGGYGCSRSFDIWSLGCVFLEFICWLVQGGSSPKNPVDAFHEARYLQQDNKSLEGTIQDTFYHVVKGKNTTTFEVNPAVKELVDILRKSPACSRFVHDILEIILRDMLVIELKKTSQQQGGKGGHKQAFSDGKRRIDCRGLTDKLYGLLRNNDDYFTKPGWGSPKPRTKEAMQAVTIPESPKTLLDQRRSMIGEQKTKEDGPKNEQRALVIRYP